MEVDISEKVNHWFKITLLIFCVIIVGIVILSYFYNNQNRYLNVSNAKISGTLVNSPVRTSGTLVELLVEDGQRVEAGQPLAKVQAKVSPEELKQLQDAVLAAESRYKELQTRPVAVVPSVSQSEGMLSDMVAAQAQLERAKREKVKMDNLFAIGGISAMQHNAADAAYAAALDAYEAAQALPAAPQATAVFGTSSDIGGMLKIAQHQVERAKQALLAVTEQPQYIQIESPVDGTVYFNGFSIGDEVTAGQVVFKVGDVNEVWIEAEVPMANKEQLVLGQFVKYQVDKYSKENFSGTVYEILDNDAAADKFIVRISVPADLQDKVKPGMKVIAKISV